MNRSRSHSPKRCPMNRPAAWFALALLCCGVALLSAATPIFAQADADQALIIAEIANLNPGVNLHIRDRPLTDGFSLLRLPGGSELELLGMNDARDWAYILWDDGEGTILQGWVSADFIVFRSDGRYLSLNQLQNAGAIITVGDGVQGRFLSQGDAVAETDAAGGDGGADDDRFYAEVSYLNTGANLHIRRAPDAASESLALVPNGALLQLNGPNESGDWVFINLLEADGNQTTGWVSADFVRFRRMGLYYSAAQLQASGRIPVIADDTRGARLDASGNPRDTVDHNLYADVSGLEAPANLHLRTYPDAESESLALVQGGAALSVLGISEDGAWAFLQHYLNEERGFAGWANATFLVFHLRGLIFSAEQLIERELAPILDDDFSGYPTDGDGNFIDERDDGVYADVTGLDAGVRLHIRIAPDASSESLTRVSRGSALELIGVNEAADWAYIRYREEAGDAFIEGWISAEYASFRFRKGYFSAEFLLDLGRIDEVEEERRGFRSGELATPESVDDSVIAEIVGLNPGANLHLRAAPDASSESLQLIPGGSRLTLIGFNEDQSWAFAQYEGQNLLAEGWVSAIYLRYSYRGQPYSASRLLGTRNASLLGNDRRGSLTRLAPAPAEAATPPSQPTEAAPVSEATEAEDAPAPPIAGVAAAATPGSATIINLADDERLAIRRSPAESAAVLGQFPPGTELSLFGFNQDLSQAFVRHTQPDQTVISGWAPVANLALSHPQSASSAAIFLIGDGLLTLIPAESPGSIIAGASHASLFPPIALITATAAGAGEAVLRELPDADSGELAAIGDATIIVFGLNEDWSWAFGQYDDADGRNFLGWLPLSEWRLAAAGQPLAAGSYAEKAREYQIPLLAADTRGGSSP